MKNSKKLFSLVGVVLCLSLMLSNSFPAFAATVDKNSDVGNTKILVKKFVEAINKNDLDTYISLFTQNNQEEMKSYIENNGEANFFKESNIQLSNITRLSDQVGKSSANISNKEIEKYSNIVVYYVEMNTKVKNGNGINDDDILDNGYTYRDFVIVKENDEWKIMRVSSPDLGIIIDANEGFGTDHEKAKMKGQNVKTHIPISKSTKAVAEKSITSVTPNTVLTTFADPTSITVYFTKSANSSYYGVSYKSIDWTTYLKNVIPQEWTVGYYGSYPAYLNAGGMASKMYAWWYKDHPKWNYAPYYSNVKDNSSDQNFLYNAYSSLAATYKSYVDEVVSLLDKYAMANCEVLCLKCIIMLLLGPSIVGQ